MVLQVETVSEGKAAITLIISGGCFYVCVRMHALVPMHWYVCTFGS